MNLSESFKFVWKTKGPHIAEGLWKSDLSALLIQFTKDVHKSFTRPHPAQRFKELKSFFSGGLSTLGQAPLRTKRALKIFREELQQELEQLPEVKAKSVFLLKVVSTLTSLVLAGLYDLHKVRTEYLLKGFKRSQVLGQLLFAELALKTAQLFLLRFLEEVEKELTDADELRKVRFFKHLLNQESPEDAPDMAMEEMDRAQEIVINLRNYLMTGKKTKRAHDSPLDSY